MSKSPRVTKLKLPQDAIECAHNVYELPSIRQAIRFMHAACGFPVKSTWIKAIRSGNYVGWPLLTVSNVHKHYPETDETPKGHLNQSPAGTRSTKPKRVPLMEANQDELKQMLGVKERDVYIKIWDMRGTLYTDQTGKFPVRSRRHNNYIMVMVEIDSNAVLVEPMTTKSDKEMQRAYLALLAKLKRAKIVPLKPRPRQRML